MLRISCFILVLLTQAAWSQGLNRLDDWSEARGWEGVGLLSINRGAATCTGALVRADLVLTAAHCMFDQSGNRIEPTTIQFLAAWRDGQAIAVRAGTRALVHRDYHPSQTPTGADIYADLALLKIDFPVSAATAQPFQTANWSGGDPVSVVSYGAGRNDAASIEKGCGLIKDYGGVFAFDCSIVPGSSGSPVFIEKGSKPYIVSVISALGPDQTAYGTDVSHHINSLLADMDAGRGVYPAAVPGIKRITVGNRSHTGGALFLKP